MIEYPGLEYVRTDIVEPYTQGGISYGEYVVQMRFPRINSRASKGWRKHIRKQKRNRSPITVTWKRVK